jgi:hypothetical protein
MASKAARGLAKRAHRKYLIPAGKTHERIGASNGLNASAQKREASCHE